MAFEDDLESNVITRKKAQKEVKKPRLYKVMMHNDPYTTREFVVDVLKGVFHRTESQAVNIMLHVHNNGVGVAGVYPFEVAETKIQTVERLAREYEYPLRLTMEPEE